MPPNQTVLLDRVLEFLKKQVQNEPKKAHEHSQADELVGDGVSQVDSTLGTLPVEKDEGSGESVVGIEKHGHFHTRMHSQPRRISHSPSQILEVG